jgi:hypothetical protein
MTNKISTPMSHSLIDHHSSSHCCVGNAEQCACTMSGSDALQAHIDSLLMPPPPKRFCDGLEHGNLSRSNDIEFSIMPPPSNQEQHPSLETAARQDDYSGMIQQVETVGSSSLPDTINFVTPPKAAAAESCDASSPAEAHHDGNDTNFSETDSMQSERSTVIAESLSSDNQEQRDVMPETTTTRFSDIIGHASVKLRIDEMLLPLALPPALADSILTGVRSLPACLLLYGPPGCGKVRLVCHVARMVLCLAVDCVTREQYTHTNSIHTFLYRHNLHEPLLAKLELLSYRSVPVIFSASLSESRRHPSVPSFKKVSYYNLLWLCVLCQHTRHSCILFL